MNNIVCNKCVVKSCCNEFCDDLKKHLIKNIELLGKMDIENINELLNKKKRCVVCKEYMFATRIFNSYGGTNSEMRCMSCSSIYTFTLASDFKLNFITPCIAKYKDKNYMSGSLIQIKSKIKEKLMLYDPEEK